MLAAAPLFRRLLAFLVAAGVLTLFAAERADAGYAVWPDGQSFSVMAGSSGYVQTPASLDLVVYLDAQDSDAWVWVSESAQVGSSGAPAGGSVVSCSPGSLLAFGEQNKWVCRISTALLRPGHTYYWWLDFRRLEEGSPLPQERVSGPFSFSLVLQQPSTPPASAPPPPVEPPISTKTVAAAATLPGAARFDGRRSVKHTVLTRLVYRTMKRLGLPRQLAFACWNRADWVSVVRGDDMEPEAGSELLGFWLGRQPRWLHLAPGICGDVQGLLSTKRPNARRGAALATVIHETLHAYGVRNEAQTNCFAVQLVPVFARNLGLSVGRSDYLGTLARNYTRRYAPTGYWSGARCRDGGPWDLFPGSRSLS